MSNEAKVEVIWEGDFNIRGAVVDRPNEFVHSMINRGSGTYRVTVTKITPKKILTTEEAMDYVQKQGLNVIADGKLWSACVTGCYPKCSNYGTPLEAIQAHYDLSVQLKD